MNLPPSLGQHLSTGSLLRSGSSITSWHAALKTFFGNRVDIFKSLGADFSLLTIPA